MDTTGIRAKAFVALGGGLKEVCRCGGGAYGEVWLASDSIGRSIAVKIIPKDALKEAWRREFDGIRDYCAKVRGGAPHLIAIHHVVEGEDFFCYSMEAADNAAGPGEQYAADTLGARLARGGRIPPAQILSLMSQALEGLCALHSKGLIHRDIKPDNILFIDGELKLGDIGCVSTTGPGASLVGTPCYLPPEILSGLSEPDVRQDVYALGKVMYCMLSGFDADRFPSIPPAVLRDRVTSDLNAVMLRACESRREMRYANAEEFSAAVNACRDGGARGLIHRICRAIHSEWSRHAPAYAAVGAAAVTALAMMLIRTPGKPLQGGTVLDPNGIAPGSVRTEHIHSPARSYDSPDEPASPLSIEVSSKAGLPLVSAASLDDAAIYARTSLDEPVILLSAPGGQFGVMTRGRVSWSCGETEGPAAILNRKSAREEAYATACDLLARTFLAEGETASQRRQFILDAFSGDTSARPMLEALRAIDPIQQVEVFLRGYAIDSLCESDADDGSKVEEITIVATVETAAISVMLDDGIVLAAETEGASDKLRAEVTCGCLPLPTSRLMLITTRSGRHMAMRYSADMVADDSTLETAAAAETASLAELERFVEKGPRILKGRSPVFRGHDSINRDWIADTCERLRNSPTARLAPQSSSPRIRSRSYLRDGWIYSISISTTVAEGR